MNLRSLALGGLLAAVIALGIVSAHPAFAVPAVTYTVDTTSDANLTTCNVNVDGDCSLRGAIGAANTHTNTDTPDTIEFDIGTVYPIIGRICGTQTLTPASALPQIIDSVLIDGSTQPTGLGCVPFGCAAANNGAPCIRIDGVNIPTASGLNVNSNNVTIQGLAIYNFNNAGAGGGNGIKVDGPIGPVMIRGNYLGTMNGSVSAANAYGVHVTSASSNITIGEAGFGNLISGDGAGVLLEGDGNTVTGNLIGTDHLGTGAMGSDSGIYVQSSDNTIGGTGANEGNVISGNGIGVLLEGPNNTVLGNLIGTDAPGTAALANVYGVYVDSTNNTIGGTATGARNVISGNNVNSSSAGVVIDSDDNKVVGNYIGLDVTGSLQIDNYAGVWITESAGNTIGGTSAAARNVISGNGPNSNVRISDSEDTTVEGNYIGLNAAGTASIGVGFFGVEVNDSSSTTIGGTTASARNVISGNSGYGVLMSGTGANPNRITGNYIGTSPNGNSAIPNGTGVLVWSSNAQVTAGHSVDGNVVSGNSAYGIELRGDGPNSEVTDVSVFGNVVGLNPSKNSKVPNGIAGIAVTATDGSAEGNAIGVPGEAPNIIAGNESEGVLISGGTSGTLVQNNVIGTNANGDTGLGNTADGVRVTSPDNIIGILATTKTSGDAQPAGGADAGNTIRYNGGAGIRVVAASMNHLEGNTIRNNTGDGILIDDNSIGAFSNTITENSIDDNGELGIELISQANDYAVAPVLATATAGSTHITGTLTDLGRQNTEFTIEVFHSPTCDGSGAGEGRTFIGSTQVTTNGAGVATINATLTASAPGGSAVTATSTDGEGNTSQFSNCVTMVGATPSPTPTLTVTPTSTSPSTLGDGNCDGAIDMNDFIAALSEFAGVDPGAPCPDQADVDCDGDVDADDALRMLLHLAGMPKPQPSGCGPIAPPA